MDESRYGSRSSVEFALALIRDDADALLNAGVIIREVTARWQREKEMRARLAALEARVNQGE